LNSKWLRSSVDIVNQKPIYLEQMMLTDFGMSVATGSEGTILNARYMGSMLTHFIFADALTGV
jgi:hypothetical protein